MDFNIPDGVTKILETDPGLEPPAGELILADFGEEEDKRFWLAGEGLSEEDIDAMNLYPSDLADLLKTAIEVTLAPRPEDEGDWEGVSLMVVNSESITSDVTGWHCKKCHFIVGGSAPSPPDECPGCNMGEVEP